MINQPPNQIPVQSLYPYPPIQIIQQQQAINSSLNVVELQNNNANKPPNFG